MCNVGTRPDEKGNASRLLVNPCLGRCLGGRYIVIIFVVDFELDSLQVECNHSSWQMAVAGSKNAGATHLLYSILALILGLIDSTRMRCRCTSGGFSLTKVLSKGYLCRRHQRICDWGAAIGISAFPKLVDLVLSAMTHGPLRYSKWILVNGTSALPLLLGFDHRYVTVVTERRMVTLLHPVPYGLKGYGGESKETPFPLVTRRVQHSVAG
jgi:hypothetical protein